MNQKTRKAGIGETRTFLASWLRNLFFCIASCILVGALLFTACKREQRELHVVPPLADVVQTVQLTDLVAGTPTNQPPAVIVESYRNDYEKIAFQMNEGTLNI